MKYYYTTTLNADMEEAEEIVTAALKQEGFGVLTQIDISATLKSKIDVDFRPYKILGACNPKFAHKALQNEPKIGLMLPCNVILEGDGEQTQVSAVSPMASMSSIENDALGEVAKEVEAKLKSVIHSLKTS